MQPFSHNQTGTLLRRHLAQFVAAIDTDALAVEDAIGQRDAKTQSCDLLWK
jgi:hypothetical protein